MIEDRNNDWDLETIQVFNPEFKVGDTGVGRSSYRDWMVHWRDETTLLIAPMYAPDNWRPAHIYGIGGFEASADLSG